MHRELEDFGRSTINAFSVDIDRFPSAYPQMLTALDFAIGPSSEIVIAGGEEDSGVQEMIRAVYSRFLPSKVVAFHPKEESTAQKIEASSPFIKDQIALSGKPTAYVCENYICA